MRTCYPAQRTLFNALQWPKWKGNPKKRGHMYTYSRFSLLYCRNYHNIAKQLHSNKIFLKSRKKLAKLPMILGRCKNPELPLCLLMSLNILYPEYTLFPAHFFFFFFFSHFLKSLFKGQYSLLLLSKVLKRFCTHPGRISCRWEGGSAPGQKQREQSCLYLASGPSPSQGPCALLFPAHHSPP